MSGAAYRYSNQMALFGERRVIGFGEAKFYVEEVHRDHANAVIKRHHYSHKVYSASYIHLGVFIDRQFMGVLQFGYAMNPASQASIVADTKQDEYLELNRMWLDDFAPPNSESRAISYSIKMIRRRLPRIKWVQSFADERCKLFGTVYQAANFVYCGEHSATFWELDGVVYHNSLMTRDRALRRSAATIQDGRDRAQQSDLRQFRYLFFMAPRFSVGLRLKVHPYPKPQRRPAGGPEDERETIACEAGVTPAARSISAAAQ